MSVITYNNPEPKLALNSLPIGPQPTTSPSKVDSMGNMEFDFSPEDLEEDNEVEPELVDLNKGFYKNLVEDIDDDFLDAWGAEIVSDVEADDASREDWLKTIEQGLELLGIKVEEKNSPFKGACSAQHPLLLESAVKFQSKASAELLPADGPVRTKILGDPTIQKEDQANRVKKHMNYQVTEQMTEYYPDTEKLLISVPLIGSGFKKTYYSSAMGRPVSEFVPADQFIVPHNSSDLQRAIRYTHVLYKTENQFNHDCASGLYEKPANDLTVSEFKLSGIRKKASTLQGMDVDLAGESEGYTLYEHYCFKYIPGIEEDIGEVKKYELALPFIVTVDSYSGKIVGIRRNWEKDDDKRQNLVNFTHWEFVPGFGFYGLGFIHLLGNLQLSLTASLRSLVDAGQFATLQGGFKLKGTRIVDDGEPISPGQFKEIESTIMDINKSIMPLPFKEPSQTLYAMLEFLDAKGQKFADSTEQVVADSTNYGPVGTTLALLDASTKFFSAIHKRLHLAQKQELKIIARINKMTLPDEGYEYNLENETVKVSRKDYDSQVDICPVSDPNISSNAHRMAKAQTLYQIAQQSPDLHDMREVLKHVYTNMDYANIEKILPNPEGAVPNDPMTDLQLAIKGKPIKAFEGQDHSAHIAVKEAFLQDPMSGSNPIMQKASALVAANVQEHRVALFIETAKAQAKNTNGDMASAAQQIAQQNQQKVQEQMQAQQEQGNSEMARAEASKMLAQAEIMNAETEKENLKLKASIAAAEIKLKQDALEVEKLKEINKMIAVDKRIAADIQKVITSKGIDAVFEGLKTDTNNSLSKNEGD